jgi:hypothetical protein
MAHLVDRHLFQRANKILMLGLLWSGLVASVLGALAYDVALWLGRWRPEDRPRQNLLSRLSIGANLRARREARPHE